MVLIEMIFFLYGEDTFRSRQKVQEIKEKFRREVDPSGLNLTVVDGAKGESGQILTALTSMPFLAKRRLVIVENLFQNQSPEIFDLLLERLKKESDSPTESLKVFWEPLETQEKKKETVKLWQFLASQKFASNFEPLKGQALVFWASEQFKKNGVKVDTASLEILIGLAGADGWVLKNEIDKLSAYAKARNQPVNREMIQEQVSAQFDDNIFKLVDAVSLGQKGLALKLINAQIENGVNEMYLLSMINRSFRILTMVKSASVSEQKNLGLHAFVLKKALAQSQKFSLDQLKRIYSKMLALEIQIKTGFAKPVQLLNLFVVSAI